MAKPFDWTIESVSCDFIDSNGRVFPTTNSKGSTVSGRKQDIWIHSGSSIDDGVDGSFNPITIKNTLTVVVQGLLGEVLVLQSAPFLPGPPDQVIETFTVVSTLPFVNSSSTGYKFWIPYRLAGNFTWQVQAVSQPGIIAPCLTTTRLEMSFVLGCPLVSTKDRNLLRPKIDSIPSQPDFNGRYPVLLQRYAFPNLSDLPQDNLKDFKEARRWYVKRIVDNIWQIGTGPQPKPVYDNKDGASGYGTGSLGGVFNLHKWSQPTLGYILNCYDLAAVVQLGCCIALDEIGAELISTSWIRQMPYGYVPVGQLFGIDGPCNNPFYGDPAEFDSNPEVLDPYSPRRSGFANHAWIEVYFDALAQVLDLTHALYVNGVATPEKGTKLRQDYLNTNQDTRFPPNYIAKGNAINNVGGKGNGNCYLSPFFRLDRVGVFGTDFYKPPNAPPFELFPTAVKFVDAIPYISFGEISDGMPSAIGSEMQSVVTKGTNRPFSLGFSNASLRQKNLVLLTSQVFGGAIISVLYAQLDPHKDFTRRSLVLSLYTDSPDQSKQLVEVRVSLDIEVHLTHESAVESLLSFLDSVTASPLMDIFNRAPKPLGDLSLSTPSTITWIHGNIYIRLGLLQTQDQSTYAPPDDTNGPSVDRHISLLADALEQHLASGDTDSNSVLRPTITTLAPFPKRLSSTSFLTLEIRRNLDSSLDPDDFYEGRVIGDTSDASIMLCSGPSDKVGRISFAALGRPGTTTVTLYQAHYENLMPGASSFEVEIFDDEGGSTVY